MIFIFFTIFDNVFLGIVDKPLNGFQENVMDINTNELSSWHIQWLESIPIFP